MKNKPSEEKKYLAKELDKLFLENPLAYAELCAFCESSRNEPSEETLEILKMRGFLREDGKLPTMTNEVVYEAVNGQKPFWLE